MLDDRKSKVLKALVEEYIRTGEPVSSQTVLATAGLDVSSATIRNELSRLESYGFVAQPHTSSGRIPTHQGYRFYVDHLAPARLRETTREQIDHFFQEVHRQISEMLRDTSSLVNELTAYPAVVVGPGSTHETVKDLRLVPLSDSVILVVVVSENGRVHQEFIDVGTPVDADALADAERLVAAAFVGHSLDAPAEGLQRADLPAAIKRIISPVKDQLAGRHASEREVHIRGTSQMASLWNDLTMVRHLLSLLDEEAELVRLLSDDGTGTSVRFGPDLGEESDLAVVTATFETPEGGKGSVGVIGPMRMNYRRTIRVVEEVSEGLEDTFGVEE